MERPNRAATRGPTSRPIAVEPVAETIGMRASSTRTSPASRPPTSSVGRLAGASPKREAALSNSACTASAVSGAFSEGFQATLSPHTKASAAFHDHTATGKLNAEMTATTPAGCQVSIIRWCLRSVAMVSPNSCRESPTA